MVIVKVIAIATNNSRQLTIAMTTVTTLLMTTTTTMMMTTTTTTMIMRILCYKTHQPITYAISCSPK